jgi:hypothetical protein
MGKVNIGGWEGVATSFLGLRHCRLKTSTSEAGIGHFSKASQSGKLGVGTSAGADSKPCRASLKTKGDWSLSNYWIAIVAVFEFTPPMLRITATASPLEAVAGIWKFT